MVQMHISVYIWCYTSYVFLGFNDMLKVSNKSTKLNIKASVVPLFLILNAMSEIIDWFYI